MMPKATGGPKPLRDRVGLLFGSIFLLASLRWLVQGWLAGMEAAPLLLDSRFWLVAALSLVFFLGLRVRWLQKCEPYIFLLIAIIPFLEGPDAVYGFGLFAVGSIMLLVDGQLSRRPVMKMTLLGCYLLFVIVLSTFVAGSSLEAATGILLFMTAFFLYLFLTFQDKIIIFVKAAKPVVHLSSKGLAEKEIEHLLALIDGKSMKEIAWSHGVKESTVRNSLSRAYHKLGFIDRVQVLQWAENRDVRP